MEPDLSPAPRSTHDRPDIKGRPQIGQQWGPGPKRPPYKARRTIVPSQEQRTLTYLRCTKFVATFTRSNVIQGMEKVAVKLGNHAVQASLEQAWREATPSGSFRVTAAGHIAYIHIKIGKEKRKREKKEGEKKERNGKERRKKEGKGVGQDNTWTEDEARTDEAITPFPSSEPLKTCYLGRSCVSATYSRCSRKQRVLRQAH